MLLNPFWLKIAVLIALTMVAVSPNLRSSETSQISAEAQIQSGIAWINDDTWIAVGTDRGVALHNAQDLEERDWLTLDTNIRALAASTSSHQIALGTVDGQIQVWDAVAREFLYSLDVFEQARRFFLSWSPNDEWIAGATFGEPAQIWNIATRELHGRIQDIEYQLQWNATSREVVGFDVAHAYAGIWSIDGELIRILPALGDLLSWSPDGRLIVGSSRDRLTVWNVETGQNELSVEVVDSPRGGLIDSITWHPTSRYFAIHVPLWEGLEPLPGVIQIWSVDTLEPVFELSDIATSELIPNTMAWNHAGDRFAVISGNGRLLLWEGNAYTLVDEFDGYVVTQENG